MRLHEPTPILRPSLLQPEQSNPCNFSATTQVRGFGLHSPVKLSVDIARVLANRRSGYPVERLSYYALSSLYWHCFRAEECSFNSQNRPRYLKTLPSAGGLGTVVPLYITRRRVAIYDSLGHRLLFLRSFNKSVLNKFIERAESVINSKCPCVVAFAGNARLINHYYCNGESLLWRESGVLQGALTIVAAAIGVQSRLLGIHADEVVGAVDCWNEMMGLGCVALGVDA